MTTEIVVSVLQCPLGDSREENVARVESLIREAAGQGAQVILAPELFEGPYFCKTQDDAYFSTARSIAESTTIARFRELAKELAVVLPCSFFERAGQAYYNSLAMVDADGTLLGTYRKSHIPDGPGYSEKYYFRQGDSGFKVWETRYGRVGVGICWDQWFPECARAMTLLGAEVLMYPTAIGSEPNGEDTREPWRRAMIGHAVSNSIPVAAANRIGQEANQAFYGNSFIADPRGDLVASFGDAESGVLVARFDRDALRRRRSAWGFFRDRRPDLYGVLMGADGS